MTSAELQSILEAVEKISDRQDETERQIKELVEQGKEKAIALALAVDKAEMLQEVKNEKVEHAIFGNAREGALAKLEDLETGLAITNTRLNDIIVPIRIAAGAIVALVIFAIEEYIRRGGFQ